VHWTRQYRGRTLFGEIDFVVLNRAGRALCIEQKNGPLVEENGKLFKQYPDERKNVGEQVARALDSIREKFKRQVADQRLEVDYLIYCPDHAVRQLTAAAIDRERIVDAARRDRLGEAVQAILPAGAAGPPGAAKRVEDFFCQTFEVVPDVHAHVGAQEKNFVRLSGGLVEVLDNLEMAPLRLRVLATAGNGKTFVARHFFDKALAAGRRPLLLCYNRPLKERLKHLAPRFPDGDRYGRGMALRRSSPQNSDSHRGCQVPERWVLPICCGDGHVRSPQRCGLAGNVTAKGETHPALSHLPEPNALVQA
jgi:hypothetical protein